MKTKTFLSGILSLAIGMMTYGQNNTHNNSSNNDVYASSDSKKILASLGNEKRAVSTTGETAIPMVASAEIRDILLQQSENYSFTAQNLRSSAKTKAEAERKSLLAEAKEYEQKAVSKHLEAVEMSSSLNSRKFKANKMVINELLKSVINLVQSHTHTLIYSSERNMRAAIEMREEAHSDSNPSSRLGALTNAEEKELLALDEQSQAINQLGQLQKNKSY